MVDAFFLLSLFAWVGWPVRPRCLYYQSESAVASGECCYRWRSHVPRCWATLFVSKKLLRSFNFVGVGDKVAISTEKKEEQGQQGLFCPTMSSMTDARCLSSHRLSNGRTNRDTDGRTDGPTDGPTGAPRHRWTDRLTDIWTDGRTDR